VESLLRRRADPDRAGGRLDIERVLQRLVQRGLLASQQGTRGGYQLARTPAQITVADVIQAIDGPVTVTACSTDEGQCEQFSKCNVRDPLYRVRERILAALGECTIAELASDAPSPPPSHPAVLHVHS
jgi:Rrf2 family protein